MGWGHIWKDSGRKILWGTGKIEVEIEIKIEIEIKDWFYF